MSLEQRSPTTLRLPSAPRRPAQVLLLRLAWALGLIVFVALLAYLDRGGYRDAAGGEIGPARRLLLLDGQRHDHRLRRHPPGHRPRAPHHDAAGHARPGPLPHPPRRAPRWRSWPTAPGMAYPLRRWRRDVARPHDRLRLRHQGPGGGRDARRRRHRPRAHRRDRVARSRAARPSATGSRSSTGDASQRTSSQRRGSATPARWWSPANRDGASRAHHPDRARAQPKAIIVAAVREEENAPPAAAERRRLGDPRPPGPPGGCSAWRHAAPASSRCSRTCSGGRGP